MKTFLKILILPALAAFPAASLSAQDVLFQTDGGFFNSRFGTSVAGLGDLDGDGVPDFAAGAPRGGTDGIGFVRIFSGAGGSPLAQLKGRSPRDLFGSAMLSPGDLDGDGCPDILVGAPSASPFGIDSGGVWVFSGRTGTRLAILGGDSSLDDFGSSLGAAGDVDGDGTPDFLVGAPQRLTGFGYARLFSGRTGQALATFTGLSFGDRFGFAVQGAGDQNGDGVPDILVGAPREKVLQAFDGGVWLFSGKSGAVLLHISPRIGSAPGWSLANAGDLDGDGFPETIVGQPFKTVNGVKKAGEVTVISMHTGNTLLELHAPGGPLELGTSVAVAGDVDGDGVVDILAGAPGNKFSSLEVFSGSDGSLLREVFFPGDFGCSVASAGDLDGDGRNEAVVGAPKATGGTGMYFEGRTRVLSLVPRIRLLPPVPGQAGASNQLVVQGSAPGNQVRLLGGFDPGLQLLPCAADGRDFSADIHKVLLRMTTAADASGTATFTRFFPPKASGHTLRFQAFDQDACHMSNLVLFTFP